MALNTINNNLTGGAFMSVSLSSTGTNPSYYLRVPAIPGGTSQETFSESTPAQVQAGLQTTISVINRRLANPDQIRPPTTLNGLNQALALYTSLQTQFANQAAADLRTLQSRVVVAAPAPPPPPPTLPSAQRVPQPGDIVTIDPNTAINAPVTAPPTVPTTAPAPAPTPTPVTGPATVSEASTAAPATPPLRTEPLTIELPEFDAEGNLTGNRQVTVDIPVPEIGPTDEETQRVFDEINRNAELRSQINAERLRSPFQAREDWRVRLALSDAPNVNYLYKARNPGILKPLQATSGVIFPYTPTIAVNYTANYNATDVTHSNYKIYQYSNSAVETITITGEFTAQDEYEANYLLAAIHFFRSATKMFYGQDQNPRRGTPPPLCYIYGMGNYQFSGQPLAISGFSYSLPNNVDYIQTTVGDFGQFAATVAPPTRLPPDVNPGGTVPEASFTPISEPNTVSWVPTRIQLNITCTPMMSRNQVSNQFSFEKYATGQLLNGVGKAAGGFW